MRTYLIDDESLSESTRIKLKPNRSDSKYFNTLLEESKQQDVNSNIINNFKFFQNEIKKSSISIISLYEALQKVRIVSIDLIRGQDDPQLVFESLNSTGVDLTASDLIRNYLLMDAPSDLQTNYYSEHWLVVEENVDDTAEFVRNFLQYKLKKTIRRPDVYQEFKAYKEELFHGEKIDLLRELKKYSLIYSYFVQSKQHPNAKIQKWLLKLHELDVKVIYPYLFDIFDDLSDERPQENDVSEALHTLEIYIFRRLFVFESTRGFNQLFIALASEIKKQKGWKENYTNVLNWIVLNKGGSSKMPSDEEFGRALLEKNVYNLRSSKLYLLYNLENESSLIQSNLDGLTIEHIMPQTLNTEWKESLGSEHAKIHSQWLHTLGNLTLTSQNSTLSNKPFVDKSVLYEDEAKLTLNKTILDGQRWDEEAIVNRATTLAKNALDLWPRPTTTYQEEYTSNELYDLTTDEYLYKQKPEFLIFGTNPAVNVRDWLDWAKKIVLHLHSISPTEFYEYVQLAETAKMFSAHRNHFSSSFQIFPGVWVNSGIWLKNRILEVRKMVEYLGINPESVQFKMLADSQSGDNFKFSFIGLKIGDEIYFKDNPSIKAYVHDNKLITLDGEILSISAAAQKILQSDTAIQGPLYWMYEGESLDSLRNDKI